MCRTKTAGVLTGDGLLTAQYSHVSSVDEKAIVAIGAVWAIPDGGNITGGVRVRNRCDVAFVLYHCDELYARAVRAGDPGRWIGWSHLDRRLVIGRYPGNRRDAALAFNLVSLL